MRRLHALPPRFGGPYQNRFTFYLWFITGVTAIPILFVLMLVKRDWVLAGGLFLCGLLLARQWKFRPSS
jgi:hypothetical protein